MKVHKTIFFLIFSMSLFLGTTGLASKGRAEGEVDNRTYAQLLNHYVKEGVVNYQGFKKEEENLDRYLKVLENVDPQGLSRNERFAFYINAYNAWTIKLILSAYPGVESIKDLGSLFNSPWKKKIARIDGDLITLDDIEHNILRPGFRDPRVHFAVNCASKGCPPLRSEPFEGRILDRQLDEMTIAFINDPARNRLEGNTLYVSRIFKWFSEDFNDDVIGFFLRYAEGGFKKSLEADRDNIKIKYLDYDWTLNGY